MIIPFVGPSYNLPSSDLSGQQSINWFLSTSDLSKYGAWLMPTMGYSLFTSISGNTVRGCFEENDVGYVVVDNTFYTITNDGMATSRGTLNTTAGRVMIEANPTQVMIIDGQYGYIYTIATGILTQITDPDFPTNPSFLAFQEGFFLLVANGRLYISAANDGTSWSASDFTTPNYKPDTLKAIIAKKEEILLLGNTTTQFYYNSGDTFPFANRQTASIHYGVAAPYSAAEVDNMAIWLTRNEQGQGIIIKVSGYDTTKISSQAIDATIATYTNISDAFAITYQDRGHTFYQLTFPSEGKTWVYDTSVEIPEYAWHERQSQSIAPAASGSSIYSRHTANCYMNLGNKHIIGDYQSGNLYIMSPTVYTENSRLIRRVRETLTLGKEQSKITISSLELDVNSGDSLISGQGSDAQLMLKISKDGGRTWGSEMWRSLGVMGDYKHRVRWTRLGTKRNWTFRLEYTDPVPIFIGGCIAHGAGSVVGEGGE
jgi:hypothetical protein